MNEESNLNRFIERIRAVRWFSECGKSLHQWERVQDWPTACRGLAEAKWQNFTLELLNRYRELLWSRIPEREIAAFEDGWNDRSDVINQRIDELCAELPLKILPFKDARVFNLTVRKEIRCMAMEADNQNILPPVFFQPLLLPVYEAGRLPCGWSGRPLPQGWHGNALSDLPHGSLRVY